MRDLAFWRQHEKDSRVQMVYRIVTCILREYFWAVDPVSSTCVLVVCDVGPVPCTVHVQQAEGEEPDASSAPITGDPLGALAAGLGAMTAFDEEEEEEGGEHYVLEQGSDLDSLTGGTPSHAGTIGEPKGEWGVWLVRCVGDGGWGGGVLYLAAGV